MPDVPTLLDISRGPENTYRFRLELPKTGNGISQAVRQYVSRPVSRSNQANLRTAIEQASREPVGPYSLESLGYLMYNLLLPAEIQSFIKENTSPLVISTDTPEMPWELLRDATGGQFLCLKCAVGRRLITQGDLICQEPVRQHGEPSFLLIGNPGGDLKGAENEVRQLEKMLSERGYTAHAYFGNRANLLPIQLELQNGANYSAIHFAGHATYDKATRQYALLLSGRKKLTAESILQISRGHPLVFLNACGTDQSHRANRRAALSWEATESLAGTFIRSGMRGVIGTRWEVDDQGCAEFAVLFYTYVLNGMSIGEALQKARLQFHDQRPQDPTWSAFILYGNPNQLLLERKAIASRPVPQPVRIAVPPPLPIPGKNLFPLAPDAKKIFSIAMIEAIRAGYVQIQTPHLIIGMTKIEGCTAAAFRSLGFDPKAIRDTLRRVVAKGNSGQAMKIPPEITFEQLSRHVQEILNHAAEEARKESKAAIEEVHLLSGFVKVPGSGTADLLRRLGIDLDILLERGQDPHLEQAKSTLTPVLDKIGRDLTQLAQKGQLKPVFGRHLELKRIVQVLARMEKNNPLIIGDAGVGKTAIVEGLAQLIVEGKVPDHLRGKRIIELPVGGLVAGTKYRGEMEERLQQVLNEAGQPDVILFIDEIHTLVGAGRGEGSTLDAGNMLKPALARGDIRCIGATTIADFRSSIEKDALERRFQSILVNEPSRDETLEILKQARQRYEEHYKVRLSESAIQAAVDLSIAYITTRRLPDKAFDLIDEACVRARVGSASTWPVEASKSNTPAEIDAEDIAAVLAEWTGIPIGRLTEAEQKHLLELETILSRRVIGQAAAVSAISRSVRLSRAGLRKPERPAGVYLFLGPSGVGKTELAKALAEDLFGSEQALIRLDMSEYGEKHTVSRLIGAPPAYEGFQEGGQLTEALRRKPYSVVLLDEIEKAHEKIYDLFLQLFDDGRLTDGHGNTVDGRNAIYIMTSNLTTAQLDKRFLSMGFLSEATRVEDVRREIESGLAKTFPLEFLNRLDEIIIFQALSPENIRAIANLQLDRLATRLKKQTGIQLEIEEKALDKICEEGFHEKYGARFLERVIDRRISQPIADLVLQGYRDRLRVVVIGEEIQVKDQPKDSL